MIIFIYSVRKPVKALFYRYFLSFSIVFIRIEIYYIS